MPIKTAAVTLALCLSVATGDDRCIGGWQAGDGTGSFELYIGTTGSRELCIDAVQASDQGGGSFDGPNAATYATDGSMECWAEYGQTTLDTSCSWCSDWENCLFPIPTSAPTVSPAPTSSIPTAAPSATAAPSVNLWAGCNWIESDGNNDGQPNIGSAASPDDCIAMVQAQCPTATIANIDGSGSGGCWCQYGYNPTPDSSGYKSCVLVTAAPTRTPAPTSEGYQPLRDLDGDGVEDVAPEGSCCIAFYGDDSCGSTLAEVEASGCCPSPFFARYSLNVGGESTDSYDCVSFIGKEDCNSYGQTWSGGDDDPIGLGQIGGCPHSAAALDAALKESNAAPASGPALLATFLATAAAAL